MDSIEAYIEEKVNFDVQERNQEYLVFSGSRIDSETLNLNRHISNLGEHHMTYPNNDNAPGNPHLLSYEDNTSDSNSVSESGKENSLDNYIQSEEESDLEKYIEDMNNKSKIRLKEDFADYFTYLNHKK